MAQLPLRFYRINVARGSVRPAETPTWLSAARSLNRPDIRARWYGVGRDAFDDSAERYGNVCVVGARLRGAFHQRGAAHDGDQIRGVPADRLGRSALGRGGIASEPGGGVDRLLGIESRRPSPGRGARLRPHQGRILL